MKIFELRDICQRDAGWVRQRDPNQERRRTRSGMGWRTKASLAENSNRMLTESNRSQLRRLDDTGHGAVKAQSANRLLFAERDDLTGDMNAVRRNLAYARRVCEQKRVRESEISALQAERDRLQSLLAE